MCGSFFFIYVLWIYRTWVFFVDLFEFGALYWIQSGATNGMAATGLVWTSGAPVTRRSRMETQSRPRNIHFSANRGWRLYTVERPNASVSGPEAHENLLPIPKTYSWLIKTQSWSKLIQYKIISLNYLTFPADSFATACACVSCTGHAGRCVFVTN